LVVVFFANSDNVFKYDSDAKKHHDLRRTEIERSETNVVIVAEAIVGFINPFKMEQKDKLYCISSGAWNERSCHADGAPF
jgi:uncharacterized membrane protein